MACKIKIKEGINNIIDREIPPAMMYGEDKVKYSVLKLNKLWNIPIASSIKGEYGGATLVKSDYGINKVVDLVYDQQLKAEKKLGTSTPLVINPLLEDILSYNSELAANIYQIIGVADLQKALETYSQYLELNLDTAMGSEEDMEKFKEFVNQTLEQFKPLNATFFNILMKYKADSLGVIHPEKREEFVYTKLQEELDKVFGKIFQVRVNESDSYYISTVNGNTNVVEEEGKKAFDKAFSKSISEESGVPSRVVKFADKLARRSNSNIKIISKEQAKEIYNGYREGTLSFYDPKTSTSYIIYENMKETTLLHEAFSHPFIIYIKQNYNGLYKVLLEKAKDNTKVKSEVDAYYSEYSDDAKDMEYISHAIDLEMANELEDASLIKSILRFWERLIAYIKDVLNIKQDFNKFSNFKEVLNFALNSKEKIDLTNMQLLDLQIMESFVNQNQDADLSNINEPNLESRSAIDTIREEISPIVSKMHESVQKMKEGIVNGQVELSTGEKEQLDTITARVNTLAKDLFDTNMTKQLLGVDKNLSITIQYFSNIIKNTIDSEAGLTEVQEMLKSLSNISQIMEEALVLTHYIKEQIDRVQKSNEKIELRQREIHQYYQIMQAMESSLKELYDFYVKSEQKDSTLINPIIQVINGIFGDIRNAKDIHSKFVLDYWADRIVNVIGTEVNDAIDEEIEFIKGNIKRRLKRLKEANTDAKKDKITKEISDFNQEIEKNKRAKVTKENVKAIINGDYGDSSYLYYKFMAAFNSPDLVIAGVDMVIEQHFMQANDDTLLAANRMNNILERYKLATGQTDSSKFNVENFSKFLIRKASYKKINSTLKHVIREDEDTTEVTEEDVYEDLLETMEEDVLLNKFMVQELNGRLNELQFNINKARRESKPLELQEAILIHYNFRKKYFTTPVTEEFDRRTMNSNIITEEDIKDLYDENGDKLSLTKEPDLIFAAKALLGPLYEKQDAFFTIASSRIPTSTEIEEYQENEMKIKEAASLVVLGTTKLKTGKEMAIARAINRSRELKRGVFKYTLHKSAEAKYYDRYGRQKTTIQDKINAGTITAQEGREMLNNWHKMHSKLTISPKYFEMRNELNKALEDEFDVLINSEDFQFIKAFGFEDKSKTQKQSLSALWTEVYDLITPLKDIENIVNGNIANDDLQVKIRQSIQRIENYQAKRDSILRLTNQSDFERYFNLVNGKTIEYKISDLQASKNVQVDNFSKEDDSSTLKGVLSEVDYNRKGFLELKNILPAVKQLFNQESADGQRETKFLQSYLFKSSVYAEKFALNRKLELAKNTTLTAEERKEQLELDLESELQKLLTADGEFTFIQDAEYKRAYIKLKQYTNRVKKIFNKLSKMSQRITTPYYDMTVNRMKEQIYRDNFEEIITMLKDFVNYSTLEEDDKKKFDEDFEDLKMTDVSRLKDKYSNITDFVNNKFKETEWYKNNHYSKLVSGSKTEYEDFPSPLWTESRPTNNLYTSIEPNNSYRTRSVNEFLEDENGNITNIRLKRGNTIIKAKAGDTLETFSQIYNVSLNELKKINPGLIAGVKEGDEVILKKFGDRAFGNKEPKEYLDDGTLSEYLDPEYKKLQSQNPALVKIIDEINNIYYEYQDKSGVRGLELNQALARMEAIGWEVFLDESGPTTKKIWRKIKNAVTVTPQDRDRGYGKADFADKKLETIPIKFLADIPYEVRSRDVFGIIMKFIAHVNEISELNSLYPSTKELHRIVDENSPAVKNEQRILFRKMPERFKKSIPIREKSGNTRADHILHLLNSKILNEKRKGLNIGNFNVTKTIDNLTAITSFTTLGGIITPNIVFNYVTGKAQIWIDIWSGGTINRDDYNNGIKRTYKYFFSEFNNDFYKLGNKSLQGQLLLKYNPSAKTILELYGNELKRTPMKDYLSFDVFFKTRRLSEFELATGVTYGLLDRYKVMDGPNQISLADAYEINKEGNIQLKPGLKKLNGEDFTKEDEDRIRIKSAQINMIIQGNYSSHHKTQFDTTVLGPMVLFFRKHLSGYAEKTWSERHFNYALGAYVEGYQRKLWGTAIKLAKAIISGDKALIEEATLEAKLNYKRDGTLKKGLIHNGILSLIYILLMIVGSEDDDDKNKTHSFDSLIAKAAIYQLMRMKSDLELTSAIPFISGLNESLNIIKSPSIVVDKTIVNLIKLSTHLKDYGEYKLGLIPEKDVVLSRDYYSFKKGQLKILKDLGVLTGLTGGTFNPDEMVAKLQNINSALFK